MSGTLYFDVSLKERKMLSGKLHLHRKGWIYYPTGRSKIQGGWENVTKPKFDHERLTLKMHMSSTVFTFKMKDSKDFDKIGVDFFFRWRAYQEPDAETNICRPSPPHPSGLRGLLRRVDFSSRGKPYQEHHTETNICKPSPPRPSGRRGMLLKKSSDKSLTESLY